MNVKDILTQARDLYAGSPNHVPSGCMLPSGTYCMISAVCSVEGKTWEEENEALDALYLVVDTESLVDFNVEHSTEEVLAAFDRAIESLA